MTSNEENFQLLDLIGTDNLVEYNEQKNIFVYTCGCLLAYWEIGTEKRVYIKYHEGNIGNIKFSRCNNYLVSVDKTRVPTMVIWNTSNFSVYFNSKIPLTLSNHKDQFVNLNANTDLIDDLFIEFISDTNFFLIFNFEGKQSFFYFEIRKDINLLFESALEIDNYCIGVTCFEDTNIFVTQEQKMVKLWKIQGLNVKLSVKIHLKEKLLKNSITVCYILKLIIVLTEKGFAIILDDQGNFVLSLMPNNPLESFSCCLINNENLFLGSDKGSLFIYSLNGFKLICNVPYDCSIKLKYITNKMENNIEDMLKSLRNSSIQKGESRQQILNYSSIKPQTIQNTGPLMTKIIVSEYSNLIITRYVDNSFLVKNVSDCYHTNVSLYNKNITLNNKLFFFNYSHFSNVNYILWMNEDPKSFITSSEDQSLMIWNYRGDKWINNYFDVLKIFDYNLNNYNFHTNTKSLTSIQPKHLRQNSNPVPTFSLQKYYINCLALHPRYQNTFVGGDNKGNLYIFNVELDKKVKKIVIGNFPINCLSFSKLGNYLAIGFETGQVILTDFYNDCKFCLKIEDHFNDELEINMRKTVNNFLSFVYLMKKNISTMNNQLNSNNYYFSLNDNENSIKIVTMHNTNSILVQNITIQQNAFLENKLRNISINAGIKSIQMHSSEEYLITLTNNNQILVIRVDSGELCGEIIIPSICYDIRIDPSGLYLAVLSNMDEGEKFVEEINQLNHKKSVISFKKSATVSSKVLEETDLKSNLGKQRKNEGIYGHISGKNTNPKAFLNFYEVGTGKFFASLSNVFRISNYQFSTDGRFLCICAENGAVSVWELIKEMKENIISILLEIQRNTKFWEAFRINYDNTKKFNYKEILNTRSIDRLETNNISKSPVKDDLDLPNFKPEDEVKSFYGKNIENKFIRNERNEGSLYNSENKMKSSVRKMYDQEIQTNNIPNVHNLPQSNRNENLNDRLIKNGYKEDNINDKSARSVYINCGMDDSESVYSIKHKRPSNAISQGQVNKNDLTNKSMQTSNIQDINNRIQKKQKDDWENVHNPERQGLSSGNMRIINKDPSIYEKNQSSVIDKTGERFKPTNYFNATPKLQNINLEEESKQKQDEIRKKNIERAMRELEGNKAKVSPNTTENIKEVSQNNNTSNLYKGNEGQLYDKLQKPEKTTLNGNNYFLNNTREVRNKQILPDPDDIDDVVEVSKDHVNTQIRNQINVSELSHKQSVADDIDTAYDKMANFDRMHKFY